MGFMPLARAPRANKEPGLFGLAVRDPKSQKGPYRDPVPKVRALFGTVEKQCLGGGSGRLPNRVYQNVKKLSESLCQALLAKVPVFKCQKMTL